MKQPAEEAVYNTAVEETAGNALLNVVVRDDTVASDILAAMNKEKMEGRVTFMPLPQRGAYTYFLLPKTTGLNSVDFRVGTFRVEGLEVEG